MFALIIGINNYAYKKIKNLKGAVADAESIKSYLMDQIKVPSSQIRMLVDQDATRKNILDALIAIKNDNRINPGDAILIYYAGHGQQICAPEGWTTENSENRIQSIVPQDFDGKRKGVHFIPDRVLGWLIDNIKEKHGDNIVSA